MSITAAYLRFIEVVRETFPEPERFELTNPYVLEDNEEPISAKGWGVGVLAGNNTRRTVSCLYSFNRDFEVILSNIIIGTNRDMAERQAVEAKLMEDQIKLVSAIDADGSLNDLLAKNDFIGDNGIEFVFTEKNNYVALVSTWNIEYHQKV